MRYMLLIYGDESRWGNVSEAEQQADLQRWFAYTEEMRAAGVSQQGDALQPTSTATTVRDEGGKPIVTDGPFAETKEQLGGYYLVECDDLDAAIEIAARIPGAVMGSIEIRPIRSLS